MAQFVNQSRVNSPGILKVRQSRTLDWAGLAAAEHLHSGEPGMWGGGGGEGVLRATFHRVHDGVMVALETGGVVSSGQSEATQINNLKRAIGTAN